MNDFKGIVKVKRELYYQSDTNWGVYQCRIVLTKRISDTVNLKSTIMIIKGVCPRLQGGSNYLLTAKFVIDKRFGEQFEIICIANAIEQYPKDTISKKKFLSEIFTEKQVSAMYEKFEEPFDIFMQGDKNQLTTVKGCGFKNAVLWMDRFNDFIPLNKIYLELEQYELTNNMIKRLMGAYKSADLVIEKVKSNPYCLCEISGVGWKTADKIALSGGLSRHSLERIASFLISYLEQQGNNGYSYMEPSELMAAILENVGDDVPDLHITEAIYSLEKTLFWNKEKTLIGLKKFWELENQIAKEVIRLLKAPSKITYSDFEEKVKIKESQQGWSYTEEQLSGVRMALDNNFTIITGGAGTGKSSIVDLLLFILGKEYSYAQTALSGRAAARLAEVTKQEGHTIHRLLGYPRGEKEKGKFIFHDERQLFYKVIIIDEISMIGGYLFFYLLRAIRSGTKIILLGDTGQLEAIGECNVAHDLLSCPYIPQTTLTKFHRQAQKSAIITESHKVRQGIQITGNGWVGEITLGELQDLTLDCYSDLSNTYHKTVQYFMSILKKESDIMKIQVLAPVKKRGDASIYQLNLALQALYNPDEKGEFVVRNAEGIVYGIKEGDKVINTQNNYGVHLAYCEEETTDIYNGTIGIVKKIIPECLMIIDFQGIGVIEITENFNCIELAYAVSIHKYQGSECPFVIVALDYSSYSLLTRELVYTALTRASKHCILVSQNRALAHAINNPATIRKKTFLADILSHSLSPQNPIIF